MKIYDVSRLPSSITLGWDGENNWRPIAFDCSAMLFGHSDAAVTLWLLPKGEAQAFPVTLSRDGNTVVWTPLNEEMTAERGQLQIVVQDSTDVGKSKVVDYTVHDSLVGGADHPAEAPSWATQVVADVTEQADRAEEAADSISESIGEQLPGAIAEYLEEHPVTVTETDPTVPAWAKAAQKPSYTAQEVGALPDSYTPPVASVNGKTGTVVLDASDVGALPDDTVIPAAVTEQDVARWGFTKNTGTYSKPSGGIPASDLANDMPFFTLPEGGQSGQALLSDGADGAVWGQAQSGGSGLTEEAKQALLDCFENVAWVNNQGNSFYQALYNALYPVANLDSISAVFVQGGVVIAEGASLDSLKPYLTVTAHYDDSTTETITDYTLSGTLTAGISTITVLYGGKTTTFNVNVYGNPYQYVDYLETDGASRIDTGVQFDGTKDIEVTVEASYAKTLNNGEYTQFGWSAGGTIGVIYGDFGGETINVWTDGITPSAEKNLSGINLMTEANMVIQAGSATNTIYTFTNANGTKTFTRTHGNVENRTFLPFPLFALSLQDSFEFTRDGFRIKSAIIKVGGTVVRNMKACYRKSDNVIGFFDEVNNVFYTNVGTGAFTKGGDIS